MKRVGVKRKGKKAVRFLLWTTVAFLIATVTAGVFVLLRYDLRVDMSLLEPGMTDATTRLYYYDEGTSRSYDDADLEECAEVLHGNRKFVYKTIDEIPENLSRAFVAIEDKRFFRHSGVDIKRTAAAVLNYVFPRGGRFGASTITQQLVKNVTGNDEISIDRKIQEMLYALDVERNLDKEEILEKYLNVINLAEGCFGVGAAAEFYYSKDVSSLSLSEAATLAAITNNPARYDPIRHPENNLSRRNLILDAMAKEGYITSAEAEEAKKTGIELNVNERLLPETLNSWYADMVVRDVISDLMAEYGYDKETASSLVYNGGLRIVTAMDPTVQRTMEKYFEDLSHFGKRAQASMIVIHPGTGDILGAVGGIGEKTGNRLLDYASQAKRPSGSVIKPVAVYAPALERGLITYATVFDDVPLSFPKNSAGEKEGWPRNADLVYRGIVNVNYALVHSLNTVSLRVLDRLGLDASFRYAKDTMGLTSLVEKYELDNGKTLTDKAPAALGLGQQNFGVTLREMTAAYSAFASGGERTDARSYIKVLDQKGREILRKDVRTTHALSSANACVMTEMLRGVIGTGTANEVTLDDLVAVAGKTGTSQDAKDKWFIAYTPYVLAGVWYGHETPEPVIGSEKSTYLRVWNDVMTELHREYFCLEGNVRDFPSDPDVIRVTYCRDSGKRMCPACYLDPRRSRAEVGYFVRGTEPKGFCHCHIAVSYHPGFGVDLGECGEEDTVRIGMIRAERHFPVEVEVLDAGYVFRPLPKDIAPTYDSGKPFFAGLLGKGEYCGLSPSPLQYNRACAGCRDTEYEDEIKPWGEEWNNDGMSLIYCDGG